MSKSAFELEALGFSTTKRLVQISPADSEAFSGINCNFRLSPLADRRGEGGQRTRDFRKASNGETPLISVIMVIFNAGHLIEECINSVIRQVDVCVELIIIDGGSGDSTLEILQKYDEAIDYWVSEKDCGLYDAMNKGLSLISGDYVYFLGADDRLIPGSFARVAANIMQHDAKKAVFYGDVYLPNRHRLYDGRFNPVKLAIRNICHQSIFYPAEAFVETKYDLKYPILADYDLNLRLFTRFEFIYMPLLIAFFNDSGLCSSVVDRNFQKDNFRIVRARLGIFLAFYMAFRKIMVKLFKKFF